MYTKVYKMTGTYIKTQYPCNTRLVTFEIFLK